MEKKDRFVKMDATLPMNQQQLLMREIVSSRIDLSRFRSTP